MSTRTRTARLSCADPNSHEHDHDACVDALADHSDGMRAKRDQLTRLADNTHDAARSLSYATIARPALPAPVVAELVDALHWTAHSLDMTLGQLGDCLGSGLPVYPLHDQLGDRDPGEQVARALLHLAGAVYHAEQLTHSLDHARELLSGLGYTDLAAGGAW